MSAVPELKKALPALAAAAFVALLIWLAVLRWMPPITGMEQPIARLAFAIKCSAVAAVFTLLAMVEAIGHERLGSRAFNPLLGAESERLRINARVLQNTLEQFALFLPGLLVLALYSDGDIGMRAVVAATLVWTVARAAFWIGYHLGPQHRVAGLIGVMQTMVILLFDAARFGHELGGWPGAVAPILAFAAIEIFLVFKTRTTARVGEDQA